MSKPRSLYSDMFRDTVQAGMQDDSMQNMDVTQERLFPDSNPSHFADESPLDELLQHPKCSANSSVLDSTVPFPKIRSQRLCRRNSTESTSQASSDSSRPCSSANSRPGSVEHNQADCLDENAASQRFRDLHLETPDDFEYFFVFKDTLDKYSDQLLSDFKRDNQIQDFSMNFAKVASTLRTNCKSAPQQSPERENGTGIWSIRRDTPNLSLTGSKMLDEAKEVVEITKEKDCAESTQSTVPNYDITCDSFKEDITKVGFTEVTEQSCASIDEQQACASKDLIQVSSITDEENTEKDESLKKSDVTDIERQSHSSEEHSCSQLLYCQTCYKRICEECASSCCRGHVTTNFTKYLKTIQLQAEEILDEGYYGIDVLADDMEDVMLDMSTLNKRATEAIASVQFSSHVMLSAVEEREKELFRQITEVRQWKYDALHEKYANLKGDQTRLADAVHALKYVLHEMRSHPNEILKMKDRVLAEIWQVRRNRKTASRSDQENWISFKGTENNVIPVIANVGSVSARSPGVIGDRKTESFSKFDEMFFQYGPIPYGRPILNYNYNINLANREVNLYVSSTEVTIIGYHGENSDKNLSRPWGVTVDTEGNIIVSDRSNNRIQIYRNDGILIGGFGQYGSGPCEFNRPAGITVDARNRLIVADKDNHRIQILTMQGKFIDAFGRCGDQPGEFNYPWGIAVNSACEIAVTDTRNRRIQLFSAEGILLRIFGGKPQDLTKLDSPRDICFNRDGNMIVTDFSHHTIVIVNYFMTDAFILNCESRDKVMDKNGEETHESALLRPQGVMMSDNGHIVVADSRHNAIKVFDTLGNLLYEYKPGLQEMDRPLGMALYTDGRILFTDYNQNYVRLVRLSNHKDPERRNVIRFD